MNRETKLSRGSKLGENMSDYADNESVETYKRRFVEDDTLLNYKDEKEEKTMDEKKLKEVYKAIDEVFANETELVKMKTTIKRKIRKILVG